jgi:hypothetical protein
MAGINAQVACTVGVGWWVGALVGQKEKGLVVGSSVGTALGA